MILRITSFLFLFASWSLAFAGNRLRDVRQENVTYASGKDRVAATVVTPTGPGPFGGVIVVHGDFGPTGWVKKQAERLAKKGYFALVIDLYRGELPKNIEEAHILERGLPEDQVARDMKAAVDFLVSRPQVRKEALGIIGWDMGGGHALDAAIRDERIRATVVCYGRLSTDAETLKPLQGSVLGIFAEKDEGIPRETLNQFQSAMKKAGKRLAGLHVYKDCANGFMDPQSPYASGPANHAAIDDAWKKIEEYFARELR